MIILDRVREHSIRFHREADWLSSVSDMLLYNPGDVVLPRVVLFLNPGLGVSSVREEGRELKFSREHQVLLIERELGRKDSTRLEITYSGRIDESYCYLSIPDERYYNPWREDAFFNFGARYAYMSDEFTWLVPECGWYPVAIPDNPRMTGVSGRDYTRYRLEVECPPDGWCYHKGRYAGKMMYGTFKLRILWRELVCVSGITRVNEYRRVVLSWSYICFGNQGSTRRFSGS